MLIAIKDSIVQIQYQEPIRERCVTLKTKINEIKDPIKKTISLLTNKELNWLNQKLITKVEKTLKPKDEI